VSVSARGKRRPSSTDDSDCSQNTRMQAVTPPANKKPRVFFTDDQKTALREAYSKDSYPNQQTLDKLANELGVSTKTVVNWFHNHRMRAKQHQQHHQQQQQLQQQQQQQSSDDVSSPQSGAECQTIVKSVNGQSDDVDRPTSSDDEDEEDLASLSDETSDDAKIDVTQYCLSQRDVTTPTVNCDDNDNVDITSDYVAVAKQQIWANNRRRKSARPQWHYEGTVLDRSQRVATREGDVTPSNSATENTEESDITDKVNVTDIVSSLSTSQHEDLDMLFSRKTDSALGTKSEQLLVIAGGNTW